MKVIKLLMAHEQDVQAVLKFLNEADESGEFDFSFSLRVTEEQTMEQARADFYSNGPRRES